MDGNHDSNGKNGKRVARLQRRDWRRANWRRSLIIIAVAAGTLLAAGTALAALPPGPDLGSAGLAAGVDGVAGAAGVAGQQAGTAPACGPGWQIVPSPNPGSSNVLASVAAVSANDMWAVGYYSYGGTLIEHWNGTEWSVVPSPNPGSYNYLFSVAAMSANDVWAVGTVRVQGLPYSATLVEHWDGTQWNVISSPNPRAFNSLNGVAAVAPTDVWAVGTSGDVVGVGPIPPLVEHWDGINWSVVATPTEGPSGHRLYSVAAVSVNDVWVVGSYDSGEPGVIRTLIEHWDGGQWDIVPSPNVGTNDNELRSVAVVSANDVWAVGYYSNGSVSRTLMEHWDGTQWNSIDSPNAGTNDNMLYSVAAVSSTGMWAVGFYINEAGTRQTLIIEPGGVIPSPNVGTDSNSLYSVASLSSSNVWAVGSHDSGGSATALIERYNPCTPSPTPTATARPTCEVAATPGPWTAATPYPVPISDYAFAQVGTDFYVISGGGSTAVNRYNSAAGTWTPLAPFPEVAYIVAGGANYGGRIYVEVFNSLYIYDIATNTWTQGADNPGAGMNGGAAGAYDGKVYFVGGEGVLCVYCSPTRHTDVYDIATDSWGVGPDAPDDYWLGGYSQAGQYLYLVGHDRWCIPLLGCGPYGTTTMRLAMSSGEWSTGPEWSLARTRFGLAFDPVSNKLFAMGGARFGGGPSSEVGELDVTNWPNGQWVVSPPDLPSARQDNTAGFYSSGRIWTTGGQSLADHIYRDTGDGQCGTPTATPVPPTVTGVPPTATYTPTEISTPGTPPPVATDTPTPTDCTLSFTDVQEGSTFYTYIRCLACRGIISGYADGTFRPGNNVTRAQTSKIVANAAGLSGTPGPQDFQDVPPTDTFHPYVQRLANAGYISGYACGGNGEPCVPPANLPYFRPNSLASRGQVSKIVSNAVGFSENHTEWQYQDVPVGSTFYLFVERLSSRAVMSGYVCGGADEPCIPPENRPYFRPGANTTRGQASKIVANTFFPGCDTP